MLAIMLAVMVDIGDGIVTALPVTAVPDDPVATEPVGPPPAPGAAFAWVAPAMQSPTPEGEPSWPAH